MCGPDNPRCSQRDPTKTGGGAAFWQRWDVFLIIDEMARLMGTSVVSASMGGQPVSTTTTIFVGGLPIGSFGSSGQGVAGGGNQTSVRGEIRRFLRKTACGAFSALVSAANPQNLNATVGIGVGGSAGVGFILGVAASTGVQVVTDRYGNLGVAFNFGGNPGYGVFGAGATGGAQAMYSTAGSIYDLKGLSFGVGVSAFNGELDASLSSEGIVTGTATAGIGIGTKGSALSLNYTFVPSVLSTNCREQ